MPSNNFAAIANPIGLVAGADLRTKQYHFVKLNAAGVVVVCSVAGEDSIGVLQNNPNTGEGCTIAPTGSVSRVFAHEAIDANEAVETHTDGTAVPSASGIVLGLTLTPAGGEGELCSVLVDQRGDGITTTAVAEVVGLLDDADLDCFVATVVGAEAAVAANAIEIACTLKGLEDGETLAEARPVYIESLAVTDGQGDLAAAGTPVGTLVKANNPATGANAAWFTTSAGGLVSFRVTNTAAEVNIVRITPQGGVTKTLVLTFAN